jgi:hypothetical protein
LLATIVSSNLLRIPIRVYLGWRRQRYRREVEAWANARGWIYREGSDGRTWEAPLPDVGNRHVRLQVDGTYIGHAFTLVYGEVVPWWAYPPVWVQKTAVVVHLRSAHPATEVTSRSKFSRLASGTTGHAEFDKKFRVRTDAPAGPVAAVSGSLAEAHVAGHVPPWSLRERELMCHVGDRLRVADLDTALAQAVRVAELLDD